MVGGGYPRTTSKISVIKERAFRTPISTKDAPLTYALAIDAPEEGELTLLRSKLKKEKRYTVGGGRTANLVTELGYEAVDETISFYLQTARFLFGVMGACVTTGTSYSPVKSGTVVSGQGTAVLDLGIVMTPDAHIGDMLEVTFLVAPLTRRFAIIDNDASTVTLDITSPADTNGKTFEIKTAPFIHDITQGTTCKPPTFAMRFDLPNECGDAAQRVVSDLLGIIIKTWELTLEKGGDGIQNVGLLGAKSVDGVTFTNPGDLPLDTLKWGHVSSFHIDYNAEQVIHKDICDSIKHSIENGASMEPTVGDFYPNYIKYGTVDHTFTFNYYPRTKTFYTLRNTAIKDYITAITGVLEIVYSADRFIKYTLNSLLLMEHPEAIASKDDNIMGVEAELGLMPRDNPAALPEGTVVIQAKDDLGIEYFEGSYQP